MVLTDEGRVFTWGRSSYGRLGASVERDCYSPVEVYLPGRSWPEEAVVQMHSSLFPWQNQQFLISVAEDLCRVWL